MKSPQELANLFPPLNSRNALKIQEALSEVNDAVGGRAIGLWQRGDEELRQLSFVAVDDMPEEVATLFQAATERVSLTETGLGIVAATHAKTPVIAYDQPREGQLAGSASWIVKFGCLSSLSTPILADRDSSVLGILAVSFPYEIQRDDENYQRLQKIAQLLQPRFVG